jgi:hypothetical protein
MADGAPVDLEVVPLRHRTLGQENGKRLADRFVGGLVEKICPYVLLPECVYRKREALLVEEHRLSAVDHGRVADERPYPPVTRFRANCHDLSSFGVADALIMPV